MVPVTYLNAFTYFIFVLLQYWKKELDAFKHIFARYLRAKSVIDWKKIQPLPEGAIIPYNNVS